MEDKKPLTFDVYELAKRAEKYGSIYRWFKPQTNEPTNEPEDLEGDATPDYVNQDR